MERFVELENNIDIYTCNDINDHVSRLSQVVLSLEGGYDLPAICDCSEECVRALLDGSSSPVSEEELRRHPCQNAVDTLQKTIAIQVSTHLSKHIVD